MNNREVNLKELLEGNEIDQIRIFNLNPPVITLAPNTSWLLSGGGIEIVLKNNRFFSFAWSDEWELFDWIEGPVQELFRDLEYQKVNIHASFLADRFKYKTITSLKCKWSFYHPFNEDFEPSSEKIYIPQDIIIEFDSGPSLQMACINYDINIENDEYGIENLRYDSLESMMINIGEPLLIQSTE